jgi:hypothetical protein
MREWGKCLQNFGWKLEGRGQSEDLVVDEMKICYENGTD